VTQLSTVARRPRLAAGAGLLFASGAAALVYQLLWIKQLSLVVGVDVHAATIAVSAFFAGSSRAEHLPAMIATTGQQVRF